jgi:predicted lipoprotein with Yx(FWY)xxD motif
MRRRLVVSFAAATAFLTACGGPDAASEPEPADQASGTEAAPTESPTGDIAAVSTVTTTSSGHGQILVDDDGMTLYVFDSDDGSTSTCYDACAQTWPPLEGPAEAGEGADGALLGTTTRDDGMVQVTYDGQPLYRYAADQAAGGTNGQGVGGVWSVVSADGAAVRAASTSEDDADY